MSVQLSVLNVKALVGAYSVIVKLLVIFGNLRFKLYSAATQKTHSRCFILSFDSASNDSNVAWMIH